LGYSETVDLDAYHYHMNSKSQYEIVKRILDKLEITSESNVLDVGCGDGVITAEIANKASCGQVVGIDASNNMISLAKKIHPRSKFPNLAFYKEKAEEIQFKRAQFDIILCANTLLWVRDPIKAIKLMCNSLKRRGTLLILTYSNDTPYANLFSTVLRKYFPEFENFSAANTMLSIDEHQKCLENEGMLIEEFNLEDITYSYNSVESFKDYVRGWQNCYVPLPSELQERFLEKIIEQSSRYNTSKDSNQFSFLHKSLTIKAKKVEKKP